MIDALELKTNDIEFQFDAEAGQVSNLFIEGQFRKGDVVVAINGHSLQKDADLLKVYGRLLVWKKVELKVQRNQRFITVKYTII